MDVKWLFFDIGNTIYDETEADKDRVKTLLSNEDYDVTADIFYEDMIKAAAAYAKSPFAAVRNKYGIEETIPYYADKEKVYPDVVSTLERLSLKYNIGVIANQPSETQSRLEKDGLDRFFDICLLSETEGLEKPDRKIFLRALEQADCRPEDAVMIGDRLDNDIFPAKEIGFKTIWLRQGISCEQEPINNNYVPDCEVSCFKELLEILDNE
ncbi:HAD family hydrolase [Pseudobutyrivibrio sp.]|uniref:HAD family hydrolase n=1 Tax=Pseudobutyrivibrio sp. TaxID=2014367 RepID=UPI0025DDF3C0|nr:HAD family hydrolase [Pseudobutyrivibrio sp.]MBR5648165.1 HAD family hydrolase [Pseudobutyrivibrio sp.]